MSFLNNMIWSPSCYAEAAVLARAAGQELLTRLDWMTLKPQLILDVGCGTGEMSQYLQTRYPDAQVLGLDLSDAMLLHAKSHVEPLAFVCADAARLPFGDQTVDLIFANFLLPWHADVTALFTEWRRVLRPEGLLVFTLLGPDTLREWQDKFNPEHMPQRADMHDIGDLLLRTGFADPVLDVDYTTITYRKKERFVAELHATGMWVPDANTLAQTALSPSPEGTWDLTFEVVYAHAFVGHANLGVAAVDGVAHVPLAHLRRQLRAI